MTAPGWQACVIKGETRMKLILHLSPWTRLLVLSTLFSAALLLLGEGSGHAAIHLQTPAVNESLASPTLTLPGDGARTTGASHPPYGMPTLEWEAVPEASRYQVEISTSAGFASPLVSSVTYATSYTTSEARADGLYYWRVRASISSQWGPYSEVRSFTKDWGDSGNLLLQPLLPEADAVRSAFGNDDFSWTAMPGAATYKFEIATDQAIVNIVYSAISLTNRHTPTERFSANQYYWRVTPTDAAGNFGQPSPVRAFTFTWSNPPQLLAPTPDQETSFLPTFLWAAVEAAATYRLEISTQQDFGTASVFVTPNTEFTPEDAFSNDQDYYWRVKALDYQNNSTAWSDVRRYRVRWNFQAKLLTPGNNQILLAYPYFSWAPIPGAERYQIQIDKSTSFNSPIADQEMYNVTSYAQPEWKTVLLEQDYFWRVRGRDSQGNYSPWSTVFSFRISTSTSPQPVYPPYYYTPDSANLPVYRDESIAWPLFIWDTAHSADLVTGFTRRPAWYELVVTDDPAFSRVNFRIETAGLAAAPTAAHPFQNLQEGKLYSWRVRAYDAAANQMGADIIWRTRYSSSATPVAWSDSITPIFPDDGAEAVEIPPVLGWQPVTGAASYRVEISRAADFAALVDTAQAQFVHYVPWQGRKELMPYGVYYWRVQALDSQGGTLGGWSAARRFHLSTDLVTGNAYDLMPPPPSTSILSTTDYYDPGLTLIASGPDDGLGDYEVGDLHVLQDRAIFVFANGDPQNAPDFSKANLNWVIAFGAASQVAGTVTYGIYFDIDHKPDSGAPNDPLGKPISVASLYRPEYVLYITRTGNSVTPQATQFFHWDGDVWGPVQSLAGLGGDGWYAANPSAVQVLIPYTAIGVSADDFVGSVALTVFSSDGQPTTGILDSAPPQGSGIDSPAFVSDMLTTLYPFDTPLSNPIVYNDMPAFRWRMPYFDSVDGYQVEIARDSKFTDKVETWETFESKTSPFFSLLPTSFRSLNAYEDNESYYLRVRIRHERYRESTKADFFDYGPWSPAVRIKLESRLPGNPQIAASPISQKTPRFVWDRVDGASAYQLQVDNDANFSSPLINEPLDGTSYTPPNGLIDGQYHWRVAIRRSSKIQGRWSNSMSFVKSSLAPEPLAPINDVVVNQQPTFQWSRVLTPTDSPILAAPRYRLQVDKDPNFSKPAEFNTTATSYSLVYRQSLADGTWYWRVGVIDANKQLWTFSPVQQFYKEYRPPTPLQPAQGSTSLGVPNFQWVPLDGAAYYRIEVANNPLFNQAISATTDHTAYTPTGKLDNSEYHWRVQMVDKDRNSGPFVLGRVTIGGGVVYLPAIQR